MDEYEDDELASDDDDAKRLEKAEKAAAAKASKKRKTAPQKSGGVGYTYRNQQQRPPADRTPLPVRAPAMPGPSGVPAPLPQGRPPKVLGPCWHCQEIGHLKVFCPKLHRQQYPLSNVVQSVSVNKLWGELMGSKEKVESHDCIDVSGDNYTGGIIENCEHGGTEPGGGEQWVKYRPG